MTAGAGEATADGVAHGSRRTVARNTLIMMIAQALGVPLAIVVNAAMGRTLGPADYGKFYVLTTFANLAFLFVDWGQAAVLPARIATDRTHAGRYLGSVLVWKVLASLAASVVLAVVFYAQGHGSAFIISLLLVCVGQALTLLARTCADVVRGFERVDVAAYAHVGGQFLTALAAIPVLYLVANLDAYLIAVSIAGLVVLIGVWYGLKSVHIGALSASFQTATGLLKDGSSFLVLNLVLLLQPAIDAHFLSQLASHEAIGWHAAAVKLIGPLILPAGALIAALYPTLCRLWSQDRPEYLKTAQGALRVSLVMTVPLALGCALFPDIGTRIFSEDTFGPAHTNLRILAGYVFLLYVTMVVGTCLNAAGRQRAWTAVQGACVVTVLVADPLLIPWFQQHYGNGGLGVALTTVGTELLMLVAGLALAPRGMLDRSVMQSGLRAGVAGGAMAGVAWLLHSLDALIAAPIAVATYGVVLYAVGGIEREQLKLFRKPRQPVLEATTQP